MLTLQGLRQLAHFDARGLLFFDASRRGLWRSFFAAVLCLPIWCLAQYDQVSHSPAAGQSHFLAVQLLAYVTAWLAYPLLMVRLSDHFGVWPNYYRYMVAYNWFRTVLQFLWLPLLVLQLFPEAQAPGMTGLFVLVIQSVELLYDWWLARTALGVPAGTAAALAVIDLLLGLLIDELAAVM